MKAAVLWFVCTGVAVLAAGNSRQVETLIDMGHSDTHYAFFYQVAASPDEGLFFSDTRGHCIRKWTQQGEGILPLLRHNAPLP